MLGMLRPSDLAESVGRARVIALRAFELDPELPEALDVLALIEEQLFEEMTALPAGAGAPEPMTEVRIIRRVGPETRGVGVGGATRDSITIISVDPSLASSPGEFMRDSTAILESYTQVGRQLRAASAALASRTGRLATMDPMRMVAVAQQFKATGSTERAIEVLTALCEREPEHVEAWDALGLIYASSGQFGELLDMRRMWVDFGEGDAESVDLLEAQLRSDGAEGYWQWRLDVLEERVSAGESVSRVYMAAAQAALGDADAALASLRDAVRVRDRRLMSLRTDAVWDVLRSDPRFSTLVRGITNARPGRRQGPPNRRSP